MVRGEEGVVEVITRAEELVKKKSINRTQALFALALSKDGVTSPIVGTTNVQNLHNLVESIKETNTAASSVMYFNGSIELKQYTCKMQPRSKLNYKLCHTPSESTPQQQLKCTNGAGDQQSKAQPISAAYLREI
ncbi:hypothetical protein BV25DRAFT_1895848 [Artomyces pyxidatus]|uniref:Uncharacterized protein n=1 Tax=Artomyces pyxidatus TaxID=48021 RepID=A0ACB8TJR9_9AGAM|nr:hypothetical protein BV25DRAFT_1895848 [Artomyces pyxidatus]